MNFLLVGIGAAVGAMIRYGLGLAVSGKEFPWATVLINLSGSFFLGCVAAIWAKDHPMRLLLGIGLLGGYTTYSTFALDVFEQFRDGQTIYALTNLVLQSCGSVLLCAVGFALTSRFVK